MITTPMLLGPHNTSLPDDLSTWELIALGEMMSRWRSPGEVDFDSVQDQIKSDTDSPRWGLVVLVDIQEDIIATSGEGLRATLALTPIGLDEIAEALTRAAEVIEGLRSERLRSGGMCAERCDG